MKYLFIAVFAIILARIDVLMHGVDRVLEKYREKKAHVTVAPPANFQQTAIISIPDDKSLSQSPRSTFFTLLDDFQIDASREIREKAIDVLRKNPEIFGEKLDKALEGEIYKLTDFIYNKDPELPFFLVDLVQLLKGENKEMVKRFFTVMMDHDIERFLLAYGRTSDSNCMVASQMWFRYPEEELIYEYREREEIINEFLKKEKVDPTLLTLAKNCHLVVKVHISKLAPPAALSPEPPTDDTAEAQVP